MHIDIIVQPQNWLSTIFIFQLHKLTSNYKNMYFLIQVLTKLSRSFLLHRVVCKKSWKRIYVPAGLFWGRLSGSYLNQIWSCGCRKLKSGIQFGKGHLYKNMLQSTLIMMVKIIIFRGVHRCSFCESCVWWGGGVSINTLKVEPSSSRHLWIFESAFPPAFCHFNTIRWKWGSFLLAWSLKQQWKLWCPQHSSGFCTLSHTM